jgi:hypothetical protein
MPFKHESNNENFTKDGFSPAAYARNFSPSDRDVSGISVYGEAGRNSNYLDNLGFPSSSSLLPTEGGGGGYRNAYDTAGGGSQAQGQGGADTTMRGLDNNSGAYNQPSDAVNPDPSSYSGGLDSSRGGGTKTPQNLWDDIVDFFGMTPND